MIKVQNGAASRDAIPDFLPLAPEALVDLSWTDPALGVSDCAWWPEDDQSPELGQYQRYGAETLTVDAERQVVIVVRAVEPWTAEEIADAEKSVVAAYMADVQRHLDAVAVAAGYDNIVSVVSYAEESAVPRYQVEGRAFRAWRSQVWFKCEQVLAEFKAGTRPAPTTAELVAELPAAPGDVDG